MRLLNIFLQIFLHSFFMRMWSFCNCSITRSLILSLITWHLTDCKVLFSSVCTRNFLLFKSIQIHFSTPVHWHYHLLPAVFCYFPSVCLYNTILFSLWTTFLSHPHMACHLLFASKCQLPSLMGCGCQLPSSCCYIFKSSPFPSLTSCLEGALWNGNKATFKSFQKSLLWCLTGAVTSWYCAKADPFHAAWYSLCSLAGWEALMFSVSNRDPLFVSSTSIGTLSMIWGTPS